MCVLRCTITLFQQKLKRKGDQFSAPDQENYEKEVANANFRMDILTERASQHYKNSLEKFQKFDCCSQLVTIINLKFMWYDVESYQGCHC